MTSSAVSDKRVLVIYATTEGHTTKIAEFVGTKLREAGLVADVFECGTFTSGLSLDGYDAAILIGSLHFGKHQACLSDFVLERFADLREMPTAFISVSASVASPFADAREQATRCIGEFLETTGWKPTKTLAVGGAILYKKYCFFLKVIMKRISAKEGLPTDTSRDHELTDWPALTAFMRTFESEIGTSRVSVGAKSYVV